jgi:hypothetical protein
MSGAKPTKPKRWRSHSPTGRAKKPWLRKQKKPKLRGNKLKRWLENQRRIERAPERHAEHDRFAKGHWATSPTTYIGARGVVSGGLPSLGKRR